MRYCYPHYPWVKSSSPPDYEAAQPFLSALFASNDARKALIEKFRVSRDGYNRTDPTSGSYPPEADLIAILKQYAASASKEDVYKVFQGAIAAIGDVLEALDLEIQPYDNDCSPADDKSYGDTSQRDEHPTSIFNFHHQMRMPYPTGPTPAVGGSEKN